MAFAIFVEALNLAAAARRRKRAKVTPSEPVHLHQQYVDDTGTVKEVQPVD